MIWSQFWFLMSAIYISPELEYWARVSFATFALVMAFYMAKKDK